MTTDKNTSSDKGGFSSGSYSGRSPEEMRTTFKEIDPRPRINQPKGYEDSQYSSSLIRGKRHDYIFLPQGYKDPDTGKEYKAGYYDERGNFYERVVIKAGKNLETLACCDFCGTQIKLKWVSGALNSCPNCGATLHEIPDKTIYDDHLRPVPSNPVFKERPSGGRSQYDYGTSYSLGGIIAISAAVIVLAVIITGLIVGRAKKNAEREVVYVPISDYEGGIPTPTPPDARSYLVHSPVIGSLRSKVYIREAGGTFEWDESKREYYCKELKCHLRYMDKKGPGVWEYWFSGVSSDYPDGGWLRYDYETKTWQINTEKDKWTDLPDKYSNYNLWHINEPDDGKELGRDYVYIGGSGEQCNISMDSPPLRKCLYVYEEKNYYDPDTGCHFYLNNQIGTEIWVYWFEQTGWVLYDEETGSWYHYYIGTNGGSWAKADPSIVQMNIWHFK